MDTVTEHEMAVAMALHGGVGIIHRNCEVDYQAHEVELAKNSQNGFIMQPACVTPDTTVGEVGAMPYTAFPVTETGKVGGKLLGIITSRDVDFVDDRKSAKCSDVMTPLDALVTVKHGISLADARQVVLDSKKGKIPVVSADGNLVALITRSDIVHNQEFPNASKSLDSDQLLVGAACGVEESDRPRVDALANAGVDLIVLDAPQGHSQSQLEQLAYCKATYPKIDVICGNVVTEKQVRALVEAGADGIRVGMGSASVSTGQLVKAVGRAQVSAIYHTARVASELGVPVIADGGIANSGCMAKALSVGASCVMMGSLLAGTEESPGQYFFQDGMRLKKYRGTSSLDAIRGDPKSPKFPHAAGGGAAFTAPKIGLGVSGSVVDKGSVTRFIPYLEQSLRHGLQDMGANAIDKLHDMTRNKR